jgi:hypothetical protein
MKISKTRIKEIIREEVTLREGFPGADLVAQFISFIQSNPEVAVAAISANAAALAIADMLENIVNKVRETNSQQEK